MLKSYITCRKDCSLRNLEALAMWGLAVKACSVDCEGMRKFKRIRLELFDGSIIESKCFLDEEIAQSLRIINTYIGFARQNKALENIKIVE
ncbi:hypothetical protein ACSU1N_05250 [Thermogladius sp. 4427co]|uniref:hypothetical protein n=1 Tax=Thermogladius sp. 4427co TaxID=3450718 RepID=UPI003F792F16